MKTNRDELIKKIVDKLSEGLTYEQLLESYRDDLTDSLEESTDEVLIDLAKFPIVKNGEVPEVTERDILLMQKKLALAVLESSNEQEMNEKVNQISPKLSFSNSKKTFEELQAMAKEDLSDINEKLNKLMGETNGNN
jgi:predicted metal-dependent hydrolase